MPKASPPLTMIEDRPIPVYERIREQTALAATYAEDGAYRSALRVLQEVTELTRAHVQWLMDEGIG